MKKILLFLVILTTQFINAQTVPSLSRDASWRIGGNTVYANKSIGTSSNYDFSVKTNNTERMRFYADGTIAFGTGSVYNYLRLRHDSVDIQSYNARFIVDSFGAVMSGMPISYKTNLSGHYTSRSLVDKGYVDSSVSVGSGPTFESGEIVVSNNGSTCTINGVDAGSNYAGLTLTLPTTKRFKSGQFISQASSGQGGYSSESNSIGMAGILPNGQVIQNASYVLTSITATVKTPGVQNAAIAFNGYDSGGANTLGFKASITSITDTYIVILFEDSVDGFYGGTLFYQLIEQ